MELWTAADQRILDLKPQWRAQDSSSAKGTPSARTLHPEWRNEGRADSITPPRSCFVSFSRRYCERPLHISKMFLLPSMLGSLPPGDSQQGGAEPSQQAQLPQARLASFPSASDPNPLLLLRSCVC